MNPVEKQIAKYEKVLAHNVWTKTPLLKIFSDRLHNVLKRLKVMNAKNQDDSVYVSVYVLLYHQEGGITIWEDMIKKIKYSVERRPVYLNLYEAKLAVRDKGREGIVMIDVPKHTILSNDGLRYLKPMSVNLQSVKGFYWNGKVFHFNELSLIEMNSELTD